MAGRLAPSRQPNFLDGDSLDRDQDTVSVWDQSKGRPSPATLAGLHEAGSKVVRVNHVTGGSYTLQASDAGKVVVFGSASGTTVTVPTGLGVGFHCKLAAILSDAVVSGDGTQVNGIFSDTAGTVEAGYVLAELVAWSADDFLVGGNFTPPV